MKASYRTALDLSPAKSAGSGDVADVYIPQDLDYPALRLEIDRTRAGELGLSEKEVVANIITALTSNQMVAPNVWIDPNDNNYFLNVQYADRQINSLLEPALDPAARRRHRRPDPARHGEQDYPLRRAHGSRPFLDPPHPGYLCPAPWRGPGQDRRRNQWPDRSKPNPRRSRCDDARQVSRHARFAQELCTGADAVGDAAVPHHGRPVPVFHGPLPHSARIPSRPYRRNHHAVDTGTTLNVMSLMGVVMLAGITMSNSILIVEFAHHLQGGRRGAGMRDHRLPRAATPDSMTSLATLIGLLPMALKLGEGSESYAPLAQALIGGLTMSVVLTVFLVPAGFYLAYRNRPST